MAPVDDGLKTGDEMSRESKDGRNDRKGDGKAARKAALAAAIAEFRIDAPELSPLIKDAAFRSGNYPYDEQLDRDTYEGDLAALHIELLKALDWVKGEGQRVAIVFEGRDAAGKGGAIQRMTKHLNPRSVRIVALAKPTEVEQGQWYLQRYIAHLPTSGEIAVFDRSWYNRAGVEPVMGFCTPAQTEHFLREVPVFESMIARDGVRLIKLYLTIGHEMQLKRLHARETDPLKRWKLSPIDYQAISKWDAYSDALDAMLARSHTQDAPWTIIKANDKRRTRLAVIRRVLSALPYPGKDEALVSRQDERIVMPAPAFLAQGGEE
jgi:polyphosphate kinase